MNVSTAPGCRLHLAARVVPRAKVIGTPEARGPNLDTRRRRTAVSVRTYQVPPSFFSRGEAVPATAWVRLHRYMDSLPSLSSPGAWLRVGGGVIEQAHAVESAAPSAAGASSSPAVLPRGSTSGGGQGGLLTHLSRISNALFPRSLARTAVRAYNTAATLSVEAADRAELPSAARAPTRSGSARWYARQAADMVFTAEDLAHVAPAPPSGRTDYVSSNAAASPSTAAAEASFRTERAPPAEVTATLFLTLLASVDAPGHLTPRALFANLEVDAQAEVIRAVLQRQGGAPDDRRKAPLTLSEMAALIVQRASAKPVKRDCRLVDRSIVRVVQALGTATVATLERPTALALLSDALPAALNNPALVGISGPDTFVVHVLQLGEAASLHLHYAKEWCALLSRDGALPFEAAAYQSPGAAQTAVGREPPRRPAPAGFGTAVAALLDQLAAAHHGRPESVQRMIDNTCADMPPELRRYTRQLCALSLVRAGQESVHVPVSDTSPSLVPYEALGAGMAELQYASHLHFALECGNRRTAAMLLQYTRTRQQVIATVQRTFNMGTDVCMHATRKVLELRPSEKLFIHVRFQNAGTGTAATRLRAASTICFEVRPQSMYDDESGRRDTPHVSEASHPGVLAADSDGGDRLPYGHAMQRHFRSLAAAVRVVSPGTLAGGTQSAEAAFSGVPATAIPFVAATLGAHLTADMVSWWCATLLEREKLEEATAVLRAARLRGVHADMWVLVSLLEHSAAERAPLRSAIEFIEAAYADAADAVFRAFVERAATRMSIEEEGGELGEPRSGHLDMPSRALSFLSTVSVLGLHHYPVQCLQDIALTARTPLVAVMVDLIQSHPAAGRRHAARAPPALHIDAVERLVKSLDDLGLRPQLDAYAVSPASRSAAWWSSANWFLPPFQPARSVPAMAPSTATALLATDRLYCTGAVELWPIALNELSWCAQHHVEPGSVLVHRALRLVALGCPDASKVVRTFQKYRSLLLPSRKASVSIHQRCRGSSSYEFRLLCTIVLMAEALSLKGDCDAAMQLFPTRCPEALPPLLKLIRLRVIRRSPELRNFGAVSLGTEEQELLKHHWLLRHASDKKAWQRRPHLRRCRRHSSKRHGRFSTAAVSPSQAELEASLPVPRRLGELLRVCE